MNKIEKLVQRMRDEEARKAVKPIRAKVVKVVKIPKPAKLTVEAWVEAELAKRGLVLCTREDGSVCIMHPMPCPGVEKDYFHFDDLVEELQGDLKVKAPKPRHVRSAQPMKPSEEPEHIEFDPKPTLMECVQKLTPEEASNPKWVATSITLFVIDQLLRTPRQCALLSDTMSDNLAWLTSEPWTEKPNLKRVLSTALLLVDAIECRSGGEEGSGIRSLHEIERVILQRKMGR